MDDGTRQLPDGVGDDAGRLLATPFGAGGPICSDNLAPLCRRHHRLKTHTTWSYDLYDTGHYLWTSPHGCRLRVTPTGTHLLDRPPPDTSSSTTSSSEKPDT